MQINFDKNDTRICKAIAILMIVLHNYFHSLPGKPGENEFSFHWSRFFEVLWQIADAPLDVLRPIASFFGHYGVHVFIFLSGYGLTKKALQILPKVEGKVLILKLYMLVCDQILKLWKLMLLGAIFVMFVWWGSLPDPNWPRRISELLWTLTFTNTLLPNHQYYFVSVWWFLSLIVQCYLVFPLLFLSVDFGKRFVGIIFVGTILLGVILYSPMRHADVEVYATVFGQLPIFLLGVWLAQGGDLPEGRKTMVWLVVLLFAGWTLRPFFHLSFIFVTLAFLYFYQHVKVKLDLVFFAIYWRNL